MADTSTQRKSDVKVARGGLQAFINTNTLAAFFWMMAATAFGALIVAVPKYWSTERQMDVKMVEIAVGFLSQTPTDNIAPAREWAGDVIDYYSYDDLKLSPEARTALIDNRAVAATWGSGGTSVGSTANSGGDGCGGGDCAGVPTR